MLYGLVSPSGKLPYTIAKAATDYSSDIKAGDDNFAEGLLIDYRSFDSKAITPRYEFGFGLCKSEFSLIRSKNRLTHNFCSLFQLYLCDPHDAIDSDIRPCNGRYRSRRRF